ncbi:hypothetical protein [Enterococcus termitis]|jgi:hypothetical protein|uniref:Uncharacterized protein n=1 Tax=Enterococcus termitis TaxID=332950 RepID=A0A1E5H6S4_9ENTE|nr:hypothetical protein [Enterococcus termitis]OEG20592.1 hypothetical protein BCR25_01880 [Enterococcus termitis]OJG99845.1 hypothetical protein RV18_GL000184 [Enterococcus termitis]
MGLFDRLFKKEKEEIKTVEPLTNTEKESEWQEIAGYIPIESEEYEFVTLIATALAAGNQPESKFVVKRILKRNPEVQLVSAITASIASADQPESQFIVKSIKEKRE